MDKNCLVLAPHTDDGELGCGGTISKLIEEGWRVHFAIFSICELSVPQEFPLDALEKEAKKATEVLGIVQENLYIWKYPVRRLDEYRQEILEHLIVLKRAIDPNLILLPSSSDIHQDHKTIFEEGVRAFKNSTILGYELPWNQFLTTNNAFVKLEERHLKQKLRTLAEYQTQQDIRTYMAPNIVTSLAQVRGVQIGKSYAEMFEAVRVIF